MIRATATALFVSSALCVLCALSGIPGAAAIKVGTLSATAVHLGAEKVWPPDPPPPPQLAEGFKLTRRPGSAANGTIAFSGPVSRVIPPGTRLDMTLEARLADGSPVATAYTLGPVALVNQADAGLAAYKHGIRGGTPTLAFGGAAFVNSDIYTSATGGAMRPLWHDKEWHTVSILDDTAYVDGAAFPLSTANVPGNPPDEIRFISNADVYEWHVRRLTFTETLTGALVADVRHDGGGLVNAADGSPLAMHPDFEAAPLPPEPEPPDPYLKGFMASRIFAPPSSYTPAASWSLPFSIPARTPMRVYMEVRVPTAANAPFPLPNAPYGFLGPTLLSSDPFGDSTYLCGYAAEDWMTGYNNATVLAGGTGWAKIGIERDTLRDDAWHVIEVANGVAYHNGQAFPFTGGEEMLDSGSATLLVINMALYCSRIEYRKLIFQREDTGEVVLDLRARGSGTTGLVNAVDGTEFLWTFGTAWVIGALPE